MTRRRLQRSPLRLLAAALVALAVFSGGDTPPARAQQAVTPGSLDLSFGGDGIVTTGVTPAQSKINAVAALDDGKTLAAGSGITGADLDFTLVRYNADGSLDATFGGGDGKVTTHFGEGDDTVQAVSVLPDGKILAAGYAHNSAGDFDFALARYSADGVLDATFGTGGLVTTALGSSHDEIRAMAVRSDGTIVVAGNSHNGTDRDLALARYTAAGALDTSFGGDADGDGTRDGWVTTAVGSDDDYGASVAVHTDGAIVVGGYSKVSGNNYDFALARYTSAGALDTTFDGDGTVTTDFNSGISNDRVHGVAVLSDGKILAGGYSSNPSPRFSDFTLARYTAAGALDTSFGTGGKVVTPIGSGSDNGNAMLLQPDGTILVGGLAWNGSDLDFALARFTAAGALDTGFGGDSNNDNTPDGYVVTPIGSGEDWGNALALASSGEIVLAGFSHNGTHADFALARYSSAGVPDASFGTGGVVTTAAGAGTSYGAAVALQPDGKLVMVGDGYNGAANQYDFLLTRFNADGTVDTGFGKDGVVTTDFQSGSNDYGAAIAVQSDGKIVAAGRSNKGAARDFGLARYNADESLDTGFGSGGTVTTDFASGEDRPYAVAIQPDGKIVVVGYANNGSDNDFAIARYTADGSLDSSFHGDGKVVTALGSGNDRARAVAVRPDGKIVVGGGIGGDFAVARYNADGSLDASFGGDANNDNTPDGYVTTTLSSADDTALAVALQPGGEIVAAGAATVGGDYDFAVARYTADGAPDTSFGTVGGSARTGYATTPMSDDRDIAYGVLLRGDGTIVVTGWAGSTAGGVDRPLDFALARYTADGSLDTGFGAGGRVITPIGPGDDRAYGAALQPDGKIVLAGYAHSGKAYEFALARYHGGELASPTPTVSLSASPGTVDEGSPVTITATLSEALSSRVTVPLTITAGSAEAGDHGSLASITISSGATAGTGTITTRHDADIRDETFTVSLGTLPPELVAGSPSSVEITIRDDDAPLPTVPRIEIDFSLQRPAHQRGPYCYIGAGNAETEYVRYPDGRIAETRRASDAIRSMFACD